MVKRAHHRSAVRNVLAGTIGTLGALAVTTQVASANHVIVKAGDTIWKIAEQHQTTVSALENANTNTVKKVSDSVDLIYAGQQLALPGSNDQAMQADANGHYTVKPGDTLSKIAQHFHTSVANLRALNGLSGDQLYIGQQLVVNGQAVSTTVTTPAVTTQPVATSETSVASAAPLASQEATSTPTSTPTPVQYASASQAQPVSAADSSANVTTPATSASAGSVAPTSTEATDQMAVAATTNSAANSNADTTTTAETASQTSAVATSTTPASAQSTSVAPAPVQSASANVTTTANTSSATPQPVASQAPASASQQAAPQAASQAPAQQSASQAPVRQSSQPATPASAQPQTNASQNLSSGSVVSLATKVANSNSVPYAWGGSSLNGMDCSGLVDYVYANAEGKQLPHNTVALESHVNQHAVSDAQAGDILFWGQHGSTYHCAIYTGNNQFVAAAKPGTNVASYTISPYFQPSFAGTVK